MERLCNRTLRNVTPGYFRGLTLSTSIEFSVVYPSAMITLSLEHENVSRSAY